MDSIRYRQLFRDYFWLAHLAILIYLAVFIGSYAGRGIDITDDSFYILSAQNPDDSIATVTQFGHYTNVIYELSGRNITNFRLSGLVILLMISYYFSASLQQYMKYRGFEASNQRNVDNTIIVTTMLGSLVYYSVWLLTPSYNWLALVSSALVIAGILRAACNRDRVIYHLLWNSILIGIGGCIAFLAKPTTALGLVVVFISSFLFLRFRKDFLRTGLLSLFVSILFLLMHVAVFEDGFFQYMEVNRNGLMLTQAQQGGYGANELLSSTYKSVARIPIFIMENMLGSLYLICISVPAILSYRIIKHSNITRGIISLYGIAVVTTAWAELLYRDKWVGGDNVGTYLAYPILSYMVIVILLSLVVAIAISDGHNYKQNLYSLGELLGYMFLMLIVAAAFSIGSNLGLIRRMSFAFIFIIPAILICAQWMDIKLHKSILLNVISILLSLSTVFIINTSIDNPERLPMSIEHQTHKASFYGGNDEIQTDLPTLYYIDNLKALAHAGGWEAGGVLIDLTGGTPGAAVILNGRAPVTPWLIGGYPGSDNFVYKALQLAPSSVLHQAWLLTAPSGRRSIDLTVLAKVGIKFPDDYIKLGAVTTGHRSEAQILWKPRE